MPSLINSQSEFDKQVSRGEAIVANVEALWQTAPRGSDVRRQIGANELSALYEMAFLTIFSHWENFIEGCLVRMVAGQGTANYSPTLVAPPKAVSLTAARTRVLGGRPYLLWYDPSRCVSRVQAHVTGSPLETALTGSQVELEHYASIRHAVAHRTADSVRSFHTSSLALAGVAHQSPGELLRTQDHSDPLNPVRWLRKISSNLRVVAAVACS
jgi:hypothetical protein